MACFTNRFAGRRICSSRRRRLSYSHPLQRSGDVRRSEADCLAEFEIGDESAHSPVVELATADLEVACDFVFGHEVELGADLARGCRLIHTLERAVNVGAGSFI